MASELLSGAYYDRKLRKGNDNILPIGMKAMSFATSGINVLQRDIVVEE
jgi:hypothetical protein